MNSVWCWGLILPALVAWACAAGEPEAMRIRLAFDRNDPRLSHGASRLQGALEGAGVTVSEQAATAIRLEVARDKSVDDPEGFRIQRQGAGLVVRGGGSAGAMYGALAVAEDVRNGVALAEVPERTEKPRFPFRAIKFNLPWMSYRKGPSLQLHQETCRDLKFWEAFLNRMAENRFNVLSLWGLHPFTLLIRPKNFPEACGFDDAELADWQRFWKTLFRMARDRGIETYLVNWNIFVSPEFARVHGVAKYSIDWNFFGDGDTSDLVKRYTRECVAQVIDEYDDLAGLGITHGERMGGMTPEERQQWFLDTFIAGMKDARRPAKFIHRAPLSAGKGSGGSTGAAVEKMTRASMERMDLPEPIWVEMKFNWSHAHSSPHLVHVHGGPLSDAYWNPPPKNYRIAWMARNEDIFCLRWGEPDFIRRHVASNGGPHVGGYFVGSECYIPAKDYFTRPDAQGDWRYAFERQWFFYKVWGRLLYDPATSDDVFKAEFRRRYGTDGEKVFAALVPGSRMPLRLASLYKATWDFTLYAEGFLAPAGSGGAFDGSSPFISANELIDHAVLDPDYVSVKDFAEAQAAGRAIPEGKLTPIALADALERDGREALQAVEGIATDGKPIFAEVADARAWAHLSLYFAAKLRGCVELQLFRKTQVAERQRKAVAHLEQAVEHWRALVGVTEPIYREMPLIHLEKFKDGLFHWSRFLKDVERDVETARKG